MMNRTDITPSKQNAKLRPVTVLVVIIGLILSITVGLMVAGASDIKYLLLVIFGLIAFIVTFSRLDLGVIVMIFLLYTQSYIIIGERYGLTNIVQGLIMLLVLSMGTRWIVYPREIPLGWMRPLFLIIFYCLVCLASVLYAVDSSVAMPIAIETIKSGIIALIIAVTLINKDTFRLAIWTLLMVGIFLGTLSVIQFTLGTYGNTYGGYANAVLSNISGDSTGYRLGGPVADPNYYAQMMLVLVPLALDRFWNEKRRLLKVLAAWALGVCSLTVLLTYSRGGFIALVIVVIATATVFYRGQLHYLLALAVLALLLVNILPSRFAERISTLTDIVSNDTNSGVVSQDYSIRGRTSEMIVAVQMFADYPILGVGLGNYPILYQKYAQRLGMEFRAEVRQAHNLYLEVAAETGLMGLFSFVLLLWVTLKSVWMGRQILLRNNLISISNMVTAYGLGFLGYLVAAFFIHNAYPRNFWVIAGIALAIPRMIEVEIETTKKLKHKHKLLKDVDV